MQPDKTAVGSDVAIDPDAAVGPERNSAIGARSDLNNFEALQINFERGD